MGLLDEILKQLEEAQRQAEGRGRPSPPADDDDLREDLREDEVDEYRPAPPPRRQRESRRGPEQPVQLPPPPPPRPVVVAQAPVRAPARPADARAVVRDMLARQSGLREAILLREILGPPPGLRRVRQTP